MTITTSFRAARAALLLVCSLMSAGALAHAHLIRQSPPADAQATPPQELTLTFSEGVELNFSRVTLTGPDQRQVAIAAPAFNGKDNSQLIVALPRTLTPGRYTVDWQVVAVDGHKTHGQYHFSIK